MPHELLDLCHLRFSALDDEQRAGRVHGEHVTEAEPNVLLVPVLDGCTGLFVRRPVGKGRGVDGLKRRQRGEWPIGARRGRGGSWLRLLLERA